MKRIGNLYSRIISVENIILADATARKGKAKSYGVRRHDMQKGCNVLLLHNILAEERFINSPYDVFKIYTPKERDIYRLPYFPDRIVHHAVMNILEPIWISIFTSDTYSCIKGKGIHAAVRKLKHELAADVEGTKYCLQIDIKKFYPSIDHATLKQLVRKKIKDKSLLLLLDTVIDSAEGVPIGNYLSQYFANLYLAYFDHWIKEQKGVKYYYRYADDILVLAPNKERLHVLLSEIRAYLHQELKLEVKENYQVFPVSARGIDFVGYVFYHTHTLMRKSIKQAFGRAVAKEKGHSSIASYYGWAVHANSINLINKLLHK